MPDHDNRVMASVTPASPSLDDIQQWKEELRGFFHDARSELRRLAERRATQSSAARDAPHSAPQRPNPPVPQTPAESASPGPAGNPRPVESIAQARHSSLAGDSTTVDGPDRLESLKRQIAARLQAKRSRDGGILSENQPTADAQR